MACIALHILIHYSMVATYMWMLAEGILVAETVIGSHISKRDIANNWFSLCLRSLSIHRIGSDICVRKTR